MAIAFVRNLSSGTSKSSASSIATAVMPATVPIGDTVLVAYVGSTTTSAVSSVTDTKGNTYTVLSDVAGTTSRIAIAASVLTVALTTADTITVNLAAASGIRTVVADEFSGLAITQDVAAKSAAGTSSTPSTGASAVTVTANTLTFAAFGVSNGTASGTFTQGVGYTKDLEVSTGTSGTNRSLATEHQINMLTGAQIANGTYGTSMAWDALEVVLDQAVAGTVYTVTGGGASALVGSGVAAATYAPSGSGASALVGSGAASATRVTAGTGISALMGSGAAQATYSAGGTGISALAGSGSVVVEPFVPPAPTPGGGGDAWAGTGDRPYLPRREAAPRKRPKPAPTPREPTRTQRIVKQAAKAPEPLTYPPAPEFRVPDLAYPQPVAEPLSEGPPAEEPIASEESGGTFPPMWTAEAELLLLEIL